MASAPSVWSTKPRWGDEIVAVRNTCAGLQRQARRSAPASAFETDHRLTSFPGRSSEPASPLSVWAGADTAVKRA